ncbi:MAG: hypothetical protein KDA75_01115 [Planctomycetaceae bacterium]|nr:hypothetical protein [Planctomycetaceae bacterium]
MSTTSLHHRILLVLAVLGLLSAFASWQSPWSDVTESDTFEERAESDSTDSLLVIVADGPAIISAQHWVEGDVPVEDVLRSATVRSGVVRGPPAS